MPPRRLNERHQRAASLRVAGRTVPEISAEMGVPVRTVYSWLERDDVREEVERGWSRAREEAMAVLASRAGETAKELARVAVEGDRDHMTRVKAAEALLGFIGMQPPKRVEVELASSEMEMSDEQLLAELAKLRR